MKRTQKSQKRTKFLLLLIVLTAILSITATYAWFSTQRDVEIVGMRLNVEVAESMQISLDGEKWTQSIQIANMRQFYGSYSGSGDAFTIYQANPITADDGNQNYVPTELLPVSSAGEVVDGKLQLVTGTFNGTGLTDITLCSESDLENTATIAERQASNDNHPYLVFDMYLRNISAKTGTATDQLKLNQGSNVWVNTSTADDDEQEGDGVGGTGLEYSARVGMIVYGNTVSTTATDTDDQTVGEQVRGITDNDTETAAIWEPNDKEHTSYVVSNNGRGITANSQVVETWPIRAAVGSEAANTANTNFVEDPNTYDFDKLAKNDPDNTDEALQQSLNIMKPAYEGTSVVGTDAAVGITDVNGDAVGLKPNTISKVRVYVWLEGQDPDCVDLASTGDKLSITLRLTKDETTGLGGNTYEN